MIVGAVPPLALIVRENGSVSEPAEFVAVISKFAVPVPAGVPVMAPVLELRVRPAGSVPDVTVHVIGVVPVATMVCEYAEPCVPSGNGELVVIVGGVGVCPPLALSMLIGPQETREPPAS